MDVYSLPSTHYSHTSPFSASILAGKHHPTTAAAAATTSFTPITLSFRPLPPDSDSPTTSSSSSTFSGDLRRPSSHNPLRASPSKPTPPNPKITTNPLKNLVNPSNISTTNSQSLTNKLWLTSKLSPPPPPPLPPPPPPSLPYLLLEETNAEENETGDSEITKESPRIEFRQEGKIFVGNLPLWIKKLELAEFFRQFGPIKNVILIKGHDDIERNMGFGFVIYDGPAADKSAMKAVEFDGVEFHGRVLTVKLDDGRRMKGRSAERARWVEGEDGVQYKSKWHEEREGSRREFRKILETHPENWQAVVRAFERIKKVLLLGIIGFLY
ncbi:hypothetical protein U1Q18_014991 [Sarracenia purpurea var. burkii]